MQIVNKRYFVKFHILNLDVSLAKLKLGYINTDKTRANTYN